MFDLNEYRDCSVLPSSIAFDCSLFSLSGFLSPICLKNEELRVTVSSLFSAVIIVPFLSVITNRFRSYGVDNLYIFCCRTRTISPSCNCDGFTLLFIVRIPFHVRLFNSSLFLIKESSSTISRRWYFSVFKSKIICELFKFISIEWWSKVLSTVLQEV